jgi:hypothetical protein
LSGDVWASSDVNGLATSPSSKIASTVRKAGSRWRSDANAEGEAVDASGSTKGTAAGPPSVASSCEVPLVSHHLRAKAAALETSRSPRRRHPSRALSEEAGSRYVPAAAAGASGRTPDTGALPGERPPRATRWRRARTSRGRGPGRSQPTLANLPVWLRTRAAARLCAGDIILSCQSSASSIASSVLAASISHGLALRTKWHSDGAGTMAKQSCTHAATRVCGGECHSAATCGLPEAAAASGRQSRKFGILD